MATDGRGQGWNCRREPALSRSSRVGVIIALVAAFCLCSVPLLPSSIGRMSAAASEDSSRVKAILIADGQQRAVSTDPVCVAELLASQHITLSELDRVEPALDQTVAQGMTVRVMRMARKVVAREIEIPAATRVRYDPRVRRPITISHGSPGRALAQVEVLECDGKEISATVLSQQVVERGTPRVVVRGTKSLPSRGGQVLYMEATAYDPGPRSCGRYASGHTAIGLHAGKGVAAVDPRIIPLGSKLWVEGYGECVAGDVGGAIKGRRIDLGFDTYRQAIVWGRRTVRVHIVE